MFVRHGESEANVLNIFSNTGYKHGLTDRGTMQVKSLVKILELSYSNIDKIICSPLKRAVDTAKILEEKIGVKYEIDSRLIEFSVGDLEGKSDSKSWTKFMDLWNEWFENGNLEASLPGGESLSQISKRIKNFLDDVKQRYSDNPNVEIIVVCHGGVIMSSFPFLVSNLSQKFRKFFQINTTDYISIEILESENIVNSIRCTLRK
ncbi:MAG: histidine phosphatase family protein [Candidatus Hodarchaeales archaeon]